MRSARKIYDWAATKAFSPLAPLWIGVIFLLEMVFFLPLDAILMLFCMQNPKRRFFYAAMATLSSVAVASIGYALGYMLWDVIGGFVVGHLISPDFFQRLVEHYNAYEHLAVFMGSFLPIPFKAVTLSAGFCQLAFSGYLVSVCLARAARFFLIAEAMGRWGEVAKSFVDRHFNRLMYALGAKVALTFTFFWLLGR